MRTAARIPWARFRRGAFTCTVVTGGFLHVGAPRLDFSGADPSEIDALPAAANLPSYRTPLDQNVLAADTGRGLVLFDPGAGVNVDFGFSRHSGRGSAV